MEETLGDEDRKKTRNERLPEDRNQKLQLLQTGDKEKDREGLL